ncbi:putative RNA-directed DNA polymerase [Tanacetum coccineum]
MDLNFLEQKERDSLKQKSKVKWVVEADENTKFFHSRVNKNSKRQNINGLVYNGSWVEALEIIFLATFNHFASRFHEEKPNRPKFRSSLFRQLDGDDVTLLESNFTMDEIKMALWDFCSSKSPGPDGFNFMFIKRCWDIVKFELFYFFKQFENHGSLARGCNASFITLIPKKADPLKLSDYRPISLIGSMYKILSKVLAARLSHAIHKLIGPNQTAFLKERQILDGCLIANKIINFAKSEEINMLLFKVDFKKAFDRMNWEFLFDIMSQMNFGSKWRKRISSCLSSASVSVLINGSPSKEFKMERGLRQGDRLSPFLFMIVAEALQVMIIEACNKGILKGLSLGDDGSNISLLQFADNALFFDEWSKSNVCHLILILDCRGEHGADRSLPFIYLGLPVGRSMKTIDAWNEVVNKFTRRLSSWKANMLSIGGRLTLVKLLLEEDSFRALKIMRRKWFGSVGYKIMSSTKNGGLGVECIKAKNMGLMGKWKWRFLNESGALWRRVIVELHGVNGGFDQTTHQGHNSGGFLVKYLSRVVQDLLFSNKDPDPSFTWNSWVPRKVNVCVWRLALNRLPTRSNLIYRGVSIPSNVCLLCGVDEESQHHCFLSCSKIKIIWRKLWSWWKSPSLYNPSLVDILKGKSGFIEKKLVEKLFHAHVGDQFQNDEKAKAPLKKRLEEYLGDLKTWDKAEKALADAGDVPGSLPIRRTKDVRNRMAEQPLNAKMVVEEIKIGLRVKTCDGSVKGFVKSEGLNKIIKELIEGEKGKKVRKKVKEVGAAAKKALAKDGSSWRTMNELIDELQAVRSHNTYGLD